MSRRLKSQQELDYEAGQVALFRCGLEGCAYHKTCRLDRWLVLRADHRAFVHPEFKPRKVKRHRIAGVTKTTRYFTEREMREGVAA